MFFMRMFGHQSPPPPRAFGSGLLLNGILCTAFGLMILAEPDLLAYLVSILLVVMGITLLTSWYQLRK